jgi:hypothetical protein
MGALVIIALAINTWFNALLGKNPLTEPRAATVPPEGRASSRPSEQARIDSVAVTSDRARIEADHKAEAVRAAQEAAAKHATYLARYLRPDITRTTGRKEMAILIVTENGRVNHPISDVFAGMFNKEPIELIPSFFTPEFVSDGLFYEAFNDMQAVSRRLELTKTLDVLLLARQSVGYSTNTELQNVITANMRLEATTAKLATGDQNRVWTYAANGAGFTPQAARAMAEERIIKQIMEEANALPSSLTNHHQ